MSDCAACRMMLRSLALDSIATWKGVLDELDGKRVPNIDLGEMADACADSEASPVAESLGSRTAKGHVVSRERGKFQSAHMDDISGLCPECSGPSEVEP